MTFISGLRSAAAATVFMVVLGGCSASLDPEATIANAQAEREKRNYQSAEVMIKSALQSNPDHPELRYLLGLVHLDMQNYLAAEQELRRARELKFDPQRTIPAHGKAMLLVGSFKEVLDQIRVEPKFPEVIQAEILSLRGSAHFSLQERAEAERSFDQALAKRPEYANALLGKARLAIGARSRDEAIRLIDRAIAAEPKNTDAWLLKGDVARLGGDPDTATAAYAKVLEIDPDNVAALVNSARREVASNRYDEAKRLIAQLRKRAPGHIAPHYFEGLMAYRQKQFEAARLSVQQVLKVAPNHIESLLLAGMIEFSLGAHEQAQAHLNRLLERLPGFLQARRVLVVSLASSGQSSRALQEVDKMLRLSPNDSATLALAGDLHLRTGEYAKAKGFFDAAVKADPKDAGLRMGLGMAQIGMGELQQGIADLEKAASLESADHRADVLLIAGYIEQGNFDRAWQAVQTLETKRPKDPNTHHLKGWVYLGKKDRQQARREFERALELQPTFVQSAERLAMMDIEDKQPEAARRRLETLVRGQPNSAEILLLLAGLGPQIGAKPDEQVRWLEQASKAAPGLMLPLVRLSQLHARLGNSSSALEVARRAVALNPNAPEALDVLGVSQIAAGEKEQGLATFTKLVSLQPNSLAALLRLSGAQAAGGDTTAAATTLRKILGLRPDFVDAQLALAELELRAGRVAAASAIAQNIKKHAPKLHVGYELEADVNMVERKVTDAIRGYEQVLQMSDHISAKLKLHRALVIAGRSQDADARLGKWMGSDGDNVILRIYAGDDQLRRGQPREAIGHYEWVLKSAPENASVLNNLANAYLAVDDSRALPMAERAYKLRPDAPAVADTLGWILVQKGDVERGLGLLRSAAKAMPREPEVGIHLAKALLKRGDRPGARAELQRVLGLPLESQLKAQVQSLMKEVGQ